MEDELERVEKESELKSDYFRIEIASVAFGHEWGLMLKSDYFRIEI